MQQIQLGKTVAVFCSSDENVSETLKQAAKSIGEYLGKNNYELLIGGTEKGLMRSTADGFLIGSNFAHDSIKIVIPEVFRRYADHQHEHVRAEKIIWVDTIRDQLETFEKLASSVIILPGGYGTLLELFSFLAHQKNALLIDTNIYLYNCDGFFNYLLLQLEHMRKENTLKHTEKDSLLVLNSIEDLMNSF